MKYPESNNRRSINRQLRVSLPGSESMACDESEAVNVGDPIPPHRKRVSTDKCKSEGVEMMDRKSDQTWYSELGKAKYMGKVCG